MLYYIYINNITMESHIGARIAKIRESQGLTQSALARKIKTTQRKHDVMVRLFPVRSAIINLSGVHSIGQGFGVEVRG